MGSQVLTSLSLQTFRRTSYARAAASLNISLALQERTRSEACQTAWRSDAGLS
jgi:hypothetical protein